MPRFAVLGPLEVQDPAGRPVEITGSRQKALLCALIAEAGRVVSTDRLIQRVWDTAPPASGVATLHAYVSRLRARLEPGRPTNRAEGLITTTGSGYRLNVEPPEVDAGLFEALLDRAEQATPDAALADLDAALALWRGEPFAELGDQAERDGLALPLRELRLRALERRSAALAAVGRPTAAGAVARALVREQPLREAYWRAQMLADYLDGRQADALAAYAACRTLLDQELGVTPEPRTEALQMAILRHDPGLRPQPPAGQLTAVRPTAVPPTAGDRAGSADRLGDRPGTTPPGLPALVGREEQLALFDELSDRALAGDGMLLLVEGEAGIGKTRLAESARDAVHARGLRTVWVTCPRDMAVPPLWPWERALTALDLTLPETGAAGTDLPAARFRLAQRVADTLLADTADRPLLLVLDDAQWADALSLQVLRLLAAGLGRHRCMVLATWRTFDGTYENTAGMPEVLDREPAVRRITLPSLTVEEVKTLVVADGAGQDLAEPDPVELHRRTGGNPFYLTELLRLWRGGAEPTGPGVPSTVQAVVAQRFAGLPAPSRALLRLAALGGAQLDTGVLVRATGARPAELVAALEPAQRAGLIRQDPDTLRWSFAHDIARQALVTRVGPGERARMHAELAAAVEAEYPAGGRLEELARHRFHAAHGMTDERAYQACTGAAEHARAWLAPDRAVRHRERALAVLPADGNPDRRLATLLALSEERGLVGDVGGSATAAASALTEAHGTGPEPHPALLDAVAVLGRVTLWTCELPAPAERAVIRTLRALLGAELPAARRSVLCGVLAQRLDLAGADPVEVERMARRAVDLARDTGDAALLGQALNSYVRAIWYPHRQPDRLAATEEALDLVGRGLPAATEVFARMHRMPLLLRSGRLAECARELAVSGAVARRVGIPDAEAHATYQQITGAMLRGEWAAAERGIAEAYREARRSGFAHAEIGWAAQRAALDRLTGAAPSDVAELVRVADTVRFGESLHPTVVLAVARAGDVDLARELVDRWQLDTDPATSSWHTDFTTAERGEVAARLGLPDPARLYELLLPRAGEVSVMGTLMACTGPVDLTLARLADRLDRPDAARRHRADAARRYGDVPGFRTVLTE
jgi:DNA-binding SARP family transcriptional activator